MKLISATISMHPVGEVQKVFGTVEVTISEPHASYPDLTAAEREAILRAAVTAVRGALPVDLESALPLLRAAEDQSL
ncbi:hypothetical protein ACFY97_10325 [Streptomyces klenkii]|uniref:hypothetical protein n=1 Tax=Streptomyces klenkii TaxID=1420899 RepID=UPI0036E1A940